METEAVNTGQDQVWIYENTIFLFEDLSAICISCCKRNYSENACDSALIMYHHSSYNYSLC